MLIEFCEGGAVDSIMIDLEKPLTEPQIRYLCHEMLKGIEFLHSKKVIHRDLKAGNVLLTMDAGVKLGIMMKIFPCNCLSIFNFKLFYCLIILIY